MSHFLKQGRDAAARDEGDRKVRETVESVLNDIQVRADAAVRDLSKKFGNWDRDDYRLTDQEIQDCLSELAQRNLDDIRFAQDQVRNFAKKQRECLKGLEVETLPGIVLGHKNLPVASVGCYFPAGKIP